MIEILPDTGWSLVDVLELGHDRWHWRVEPVAKFRSGDEIVFATCDALDGQIKPHTCGADPARLDTRGIHPLIGPVFIADDEPGDLVKIELGGVIASPFGITSQRSSLGLLAGDEYEPCVVHWALDGDRAVSDQQPGVGVPSTPLRGIVGRAPSQEVVGHTRRLEVDPVRPDSAVADVGLRTGPPRSNAGIIDVRQLRKVARLLVSVKQTGEFLSVGDAHFARGDGEACNMATELRSTAHSRIQLRKGVGGSGIAALCPPPIQSTTSPNSSVLGRPDDRGEQLMKSTGGRN